MRSDEQETMADAIRAALDAQGFLHHMGASVDEVAPGKLVIPRGEGGLGALGECQTLRSPQ